MPATPEQVLVTNGGKQALYNLFQVLLNPGDEVVIPSPCWLSYPPMVELAGASVRALRARKRPQKVPAAGVARVLR